MILLRRKIYSVPNKVSEYITSSGDAITSVVKEPVESVEKSLGYVENKLPKGVVRKRVGSIRKGVKTVFSGIRKKKNK